MNDAPTGFGEYVKILRLQNKLTQSKAARKLGFTAQKLCDIEAGRRYTKRVSLALITNFAKVYNVPIAKIIRETQTSITSEKSLTELINELAPHARLAELVSKSLMEELKSYPPELESKAIEVYNVVMDIRVLVGALRKRHFNTEDSTLEPDTEDKDDET